jgi:hypothetical protein
MASISVDDVLLRNSAAVRLDVVCGLQAFCSVESDRLRKYTGQFGAVWVTEQTANGCCH